MSAASDYVRPTSLEDALSVLGARSVQIAAGCTDLFPATAHKLLPGPVLDISAVSELRGIAHVDGGIRIGAATTWTDIIEADLPPACDGLKLAAREVGAKQIQNRGTIGGNLCNASPAADGVPPLLTMEATVELTSVRGKRLISLAEFIIGPRRIDLAADELLSAVLLPTDGLTGTGNFLKLGARSYLVISIAMVAVRIEQKDGVVTSAACSVGACGPVATRLPSVEATLIGKSLDASLVTQSDVAAHLSPIADVRAGAEYRVEAATELLRRSLVDLGAMGVMA